MFFLPILIFLQEMHVGPRPGSDETGETTPGVLVVTPLRLEDTVKPWSCEAVKPVPISNMSVTWTSTVLGRVLFQWRPLSCPDPLLWNLCQSAGEPPADLDIFSPRIWRFWSDPEWPMQIPTLQLFPHPHPAGVRSNVAPAPGSNYEFDNHSTIIAFNGL